MLKLVEINGTMASVELTAISKPSYRFAVLPIIRE